ncbi:hypothetical protein [Bacillus solimangrovi]|uniref:DUF2178 domain-containing protein n=1 Tax=Bacillus solimangrovi TaxID=1305675 RepID=A0A1E5LAJ6_9BACI|nr:hypothetical protein [Bacillus solimangrovi]OEH91114.1 hypothetical protein BFG57_07010 [Bacillus solimangrovi]
MKNQKSQGFLWKIIFATIVALGFGSLGMIKGEFNYRIVIIILVTTTTSFLFSMWREKRNGNAPEYDERSVMLLQRYFTFVLYFLLLGSLLVLIILNYMGIQYIQFETGMLILYLVLLLLLIIIGLLIVKRI